jgi:MFS family permease
VALVGATLFVDMAAYSAITPLLPGYADDLGLSKAETGVLGAAFAAGTFAAALPGGWLAARIGGRSTVLIGLAMMGASALVFGLGGGIALLDTARFVQGAGGALTWAGALAWLVSATPRDRRGAVIGTALGAAIAGTLAGPALGALAEVVGTAGVFGGFLGLAVLLGALALRFPDAPPAFPVRPGDLRRLFGDRRVHGGMWLIGFPGLAFGVINVLGPLRLDELGASVATIAVVFLVAAGAEAAMSPLAGRLADRHGPLAPVRVGLAVTVVLVIGLALPRASPCSRSASSRSARRSGRCGRRRSRSSPTRSRTSRSTRRWATGSPTSAGRSGRRRAARAGARWPARRATPCPTWRSRAWRR